VSLPLITTHTTLGHSGLGKRFSSNNRNDSTPMGGSCGNRLPPSGPSLIQDGLERILGKFYWINI
jgi:hypothetical protein